MTEKQLPPGQMKALIYAMIAETMCIVAGVSGWLATGKIIWLVIGVVAGIGFSVPAVIELIRARKGQK